jgi:PKHD-type hydroxylase
MWLTRVERLLDSAQVNEVRRLLATAPFVDGRLTAGPASAAVKNNVQADRKAWDPTALDQIVIGALNRNPTVQSVALPERFVPPHYARYETGMSFGAHTDNPFMNAPGSAVRTDVSCTVFLSEPDSYQGGALEIDTSAGTATWKLPAGDAILYPSGALHRVQEVTAGTRLVAVTWIQSRIASAHQRGILHDVDLICTVLNQRDSRAPEARLAMKTYGDLMRMWASS